MVTIDVKAIGKPGAGIVILARFYDKSDHGMRSAKRADATGHATFTGPIPQEAPVGIAKIAVSATDLSNNQSAIKNLDYVVTGPGCE